MSSNAQIRQRVGATTVQAIAAIARFVSGRVRYLVAAFRNRRDIELLASFDDRMLADIGLTRSDLRYALREPIWRDPPGTLATRAGKGRGGRGGGRHPQSAALTAPSIVPEDVGRNAIAPGSRRRPSLATRTA